MQWPLSIIIGSETTSIIFKQEKLNIDLLLEKLVYNYTLNNIWSYDILTLQFKTFSVECRGLLDFHVVK